MSLVTVIHPAYKPDKEETAFAGFKGCCEVLQLPYHIQHNWKKYKLNKQVVTVTVNGKAFTSAGDNAFYEAVTKAGIYLIITFSALHEYKQDAEIRIDANDFLKWEFR